MENNVKVLKLITGEVVIARVEQKGTMLILDKPITLKESGHVGYVVEPWIPAGKSENITISIDHVIAQDEPKPVVEEYYLESVMGITS